VDKPTERELQLAERIFQLREREDFAGFSYHGQLWSVSKARRLVADREPDVLVLDEALLAATKAPSFDGSWTTPEAELFDPVIVIPLPTEIFGPAPGDIVIDGWRQVFITLSEWIGELLAHFLTPAEEREIRESDAWESPDPHVPWHAQRRET
jgi:hypothetical protein